MQTPSSSKHKDDELARMSKNTMPTIDIYDADSREQAAVLSPV